MRKHKIFRRWAILALVLVMLCNTLTAQAITTEISVGSYEELVTAIKQAENMDTITISSFLVVPIGSTLGDNSKQIIIKFTGNGALEFEQDNSCRTASTVTNLIIDGDGKRSLSPLLRARGKIDFNNCEFKRANTGAVYAGYAQLSFTNCTFFANDGTYGGHFNAGYSTTAVFDNCSFSYGITTTKGGGIYIGANADITFRNCIITANESVYGGGIFNAGSVTLEKTLLYNNHSSTGGDDLCTSTTTYNLGDMGDIEQAFKERNITIKPLSWKQSTDEYNGQKYYKLLYTSSFTEAEPTDPPESGDTDGGEDNPTEGEGEQSGDDEGGSENEKEDDPDDPTESEGGNNDPTGGETEPPKDDENSENGEEPAPPIDEDNEQTDDKDNGSVAGGSNDSHDTTISGSGNTEGSYNTDDHSTSNSGNTDSHNTDDHSIVDNSSHDTSITDNSDHSSSTENSGNTSTITDSHNDNSTSNSGNISTATDSHDDNSISNSSNTSNVSNTDNSVFSYDASTYDNSSNNSTYFEDNSYSDSSSTYSYYYESHTEQGGSYAVEIVEMPQYAAVDGSGGSQPVNVTVPVTINTAGIENGYNGSTAALTPVQNIKIQAEGVDVVYEYTAEGVSISISTPKAVVTAETEALALPRAYSPTISNQEPERADQGSAQSYNWVEFVSMILLALLVLGELRDKLKKTA